MLKTLSKIQPGLAVGSPHLKLNIYLVQGVHVSYIPLCVKLHALRLVHVKKEAEFV